MKVDRNLGGTGAVPSSLSGTPQRASLQFCVFLSVALLPLRGFSQNVPPSITNPIADATLFRGASAEVVPLTIYFTDPDTTGVRLTTALGEMDFAFYDQRTPITVANFRQYLDSALFA